LTPAGPSEPEARIGGRTFQPRHGALGRGEAERSHGRVPQALRIDPDYSLAYNNLGNALVAQGRPGEATGQYREALRSNPSTVRATGRRPAGVIVKDPIDLPSLPRQAVSP